MTEATLDQAEIITRMIDYLTANRAKIKAIIGLGDLVTGSIKRVFDQVGVKPGEIPVVGWGNSLDTTQEVLNGYVNAAQWQDPQATSYVALSLAAMAAGGIPAGLRRHHRRALREGHRAGLRRHPVGQIGSDHRDIRGGRRRRECPVDAATARATRQRCPQSNSSASLTWKIAPSLQRLIARPEFGPFVLLVVELVVFWRDQPDFLSPQNISNTLAFTVELGLIALAMTLLMTVRRVRPLGRLGVRLLAGADVDAVQQPAPPRWRSASSSRWSSPR